MRHKITTDLRYPILWHETMGAWAACMGPSGSLLRDFSEFRNHMSFVNADIATVWAPNDGCDGITLDGVNDYVRAAVSNYRSLDNAGTITAWVRPSSVANFPTIFSSGDEGGTASYLTMAVSNAGTLRFLVSGANIMHGTSTVLGDGTWHHVAVSSNGASYTFYVDGKEDAVVPQTGTNNGSWFSASANRDNVCIGALVRSSAGDYMTGSVDDVRVYRTPLSTWAIAMLARRRGIAYETLGRRRSIIEAVAATSAVRRQLFLQGGLFA